MVGIQLIDSTGDLKITNGHLSIGNTDYQNQYIILTSPPGDIKMFPTLGVGIEQMANDENINQWQHSIRENFKADNITLENINLKQGIIQASYNN